MGAPSALRTAGAEDLFARGVEQFGILKNSIVYSYYSSEIGSVQELKYDTNPFQAEFPGCQNPDEHKSS